MVTVAVSPNLNAESSKTTVAVGRLVSIVKLAELVVPEPAFPAASETPVLSRVIALVASSVFPEGVNVAVKVIPPSKELTTERVPFEMVRSAFVNPVTASEKVMVTVAVSPNLNAESSKTTVTVGRLVSIVKLAELVVPEPLFPAASTIPVLSNTIAFVASSTDEEGV